MSEKQIEQYLVKRVKELGGRAFKFVSPGNAGVPDRLVVLPSGRAVFVELKAPGKKPTPAQHNQIRFLAGLDFTVRIIDNRNKVDEFIAFEKLELAKRDDVVMVVHDL